MLSGNGRHRRPRQAPALLVAAGVTGSAIAIPLLGAASANAADGTTWDKVAECESGGSWSADNGNGYYGGLQISQDDWDKYGGAQYADTADQASRSQQISIAEKILADRGTTPWAMCALTAGLTSNSGSVDVDTGLGGSGSGSGSAHAGTQDPGDPGTANGSAGHSDASGTSGSPDSPSSSGSSPSDAPSSDSSDPAATPTPGASKGSGDDGGASGHKSGKSSSPGSGGAQGDASATPDPATGDPDNSWQTGGSSSLVDTGALLSGGRHRGGSADETVTSGQEADSSGRHAAPDASTYTVRTGDTLASIADSQDVGGGWRALYSANKGAIGSDPNHISAGQTLELGTETGDK